MVYAQNYEPDIYCTAAYSDEENCVVFDPDNLEDSSNLSEFLERYMKEDWPSDDKHVTILKKTAWDWTSDEEDNIQDKNKKKISILPDMGYNTKSKTGCSSSENERPEAQRPRMKKTKVERVDKATSVSSIVAATSKEKRAKMVSVGCMTAHVALTAICSQKNVSRKKNVDRKLWQTAMILSGRNPALSPPVPCLEMNACEIRHIGRILADLCFHSKEYKEEIKSAVDCDNKALKYGIAGIGLGFTGYLIYKAFS